MALGDEQYILFTTFRRDGTPVSSPTWIVALDEGTFGFWTSSGSGKAKRLGHTAKVIVQPSNARGQVKRGTLPIDATARLVGAPEAEYAAITGKIRAKYGFMTKVTHVLGVVGGVVKRNRIPYGDRCVVISLSA